MRIRNNVQAFNAYRQLNNNQNTLGDQLEKLSSGYRINRAADDAAGLVTSENLRAKISGLQVAQRNANDGISVAQTAEGSLDEVGTILRRMRDLAVQAANTGGQTGTAVQAAQDELNQLTSELDRIFTSSKYGDKVLFSAGTNTNFTFQIGADSGDTVTLTIPSTNVGASALAISNLSLANSPAAAIDALDSAINVISGLRGTIGAFQNRMESSVRNLGIATENLQAAESRIRDADMARETVEFTKAQILQQAGVAMLAQANQTPQSVLQLLQ